MNLSNGFKYVYWYSIWRLCTRWSTLFGRICTQTWTKPSLLNLYNYRMLILAELCAFTVQVRRRAAWARCAMCAEYSTTTLGYAQKCQIRSYTLFTACRLRCSQVELTSRTGRNPQAIRRVFNLLLCKLTVTFAMCLRSTPTCLLAVPRERS